MLTHLKID